MEALAEASVEASVGTAVEAAETAPTPTEKKISNGSIDSDSEHFIFSSRGNYFSIVKFERSIFTYFYPK